METFQSVQIKTSKINIYRRLQPTKGFDGELRVQERQQVKDQQFYSPVSVAYIIYSISRLEFQPIHVNSIQYKAVYSRFIETKRNLNRKIKALFFFEVVLIIEIM